MSDYTIEDLTSFMLSKPISGREIGIILNGQAELIGRKVVGTKGYADKSYTLASRVGRGGVALDPVPVTLCDTRPLYEASRVAAIKRCRTHHKRIVRMRAEWIARGGQNA